MSEDFSDFFVSSIKNQEQGMELLKKLLDAARPSAVYGEPVTAGEHTVITACEVSAGLGFGFGSGAGTAPASVQNAEAEAAQGGEEIHGEATGGGGGGGGGGGAVSRPVAYIAIGPHGVRMEPMFDLTKVAVAFFTMLGSMFIMLGKMRRPR